MILVPSKKAVVFKLRDPGRILNVIPTAKTFTLREQLLVAVPHRVEETKVLRNLGFDVPAPIRYYYDWPRAGWITPFHAQYESAAFLSLYGRAFNLSSLGTGKSLSTLWAYDYLRVTGVVHKMLVVASLSTLERTWADEIFTHFPHLNFAVLHGSRDKRLKLLAQDVDVYIINHDGIEIIAPELARRPDIDIVALDEIAQAARNASTDRWKALNKVINKQTPRMCWGMTGTPTPNAPTDAWAQCRLVVPEAVPPYFNRFRDLVMRQVNTYKWADRAEAVEVVRAAMQPAVRFTRDECVDLPPQIVESRTVEMTPQQAKAYKEMLDRLHTEIEAGQVTAVNEAVKMAKLLQIAVGTVYGTAGEEIVIPATPRVNAVREIIEEAEGKVIVFVPFVSAVRHVAEELGKRYSVEIIHGGVSKSERDRIFGAFQKSAEPRILVAQPAAMSHGLTLTAASVIVWFAPVTSNEVFTQANGRIQRPGQKRTTFIIELEGTPVERKLYTRLKHKQKLEGLLLDEVKASRGAVIA